MAGMPPATIEVSDAVVHALIRAQRPDLSGRSLVRIANGWDNATFRLGDDLAVRVPRRAEAVPLILHEQQYLPSIANRTPVPVPVPVHAGSPTSDFPWPWSIVRWVPGAPAVEAGPADRAPAVDGLAAFLRSLNVPADEGVPVNPLRGVPLADRNAAVRERLGDRERYPQAAGLREVWAQACAVPVWDGPAMMLHGDLHPANILLAADGSLAGVIDFGDVGAGDPAVDLAVGWLMFDAGARQRFIGAFGSSVDRGTWMRARGWALVLSTAMLSNSDDNPRMFSVGEFGIRQVLAR
ncbi:putative phosphotransferase [Arthrobacter globiformis NBRC 12137]|uniref:Putative phosphotransferase n=1 Tax=Arthrobacter globiformis (strain ATCC 8010 / DSM 20124 / JCM 1332 / NBRC 12137 / NCIMB 8907 / NRRL B-2979 / 168) TaxID=1077972 RepID=H0QIK4_ARTG1|nr:aminoglycoside phosphotransferase family protein [Arthrobacter globiformis]GAB12655.1 putative phosphotransferase [Arthrobacter globiformis NBRC 12137]